MGKVKLSELNTILNSELGSTDSIPVVDAEAVQTKRLTILELDKRFTKYADLVVDEDDMISNSATKVPTQQSTKAYVDAVASDVETISTDLDAAEADIATAEDDIEALEDDVADLEANVNYLLFAIVQVGSIIMWPSATPPESWLFLNGDTIGGSSSGAVHASPDYWPLFNFLWHSLDNTAVPILDSFGVASTRGASSAADYAAHKRLTLPNMAGLLPRMPGTQAINGRNKVGPTIGLPQEDQMQGHWHAELVDPAGNVRRSDSGGTNGVNPGTAAGIRSGTQPSAETVRIKDAVTDGTNGTPRTGTETRGAAFGVNFIIKI